MSTKDLLYYKSLEYSVIIRREELDGETWYVAYCNELGFNACHGMGEDKVSALNSFVEEKDAFIEMLYENGERIPEVVHEECNLSGVFSVRTSPWIHSSLAQQAKTYGISLNAYVNQLIAFGIGQADLSLRFERKVDEFSEKVMEQNHAILQSLNTISYKTNSLFGDSCKARFVQKSTEYNTAV